MQDNMAGDEPHEKSISTILDPVILPLAHQDSKPLPRHRSSYARKAKKVVSCKDDMAIKEMNLMWKGTRQQT